MYLQRRKTGNKPRDATTPHGTSAAESVRNLIKKNPKYSKRINYDALKDLFVDGGGLPSFTANMSTGNDDKDDADLYTMGDDKSDGEGMVIIEEEGGTVAVAPRLPSASGQKGAAGLADRGDADADGDMDEGSDDDKGDDIGWEDVYEQEV